MSHFLKTTAWVRDVLFLNIHHHMKLQYSIHSKALVMLPPQKFVLPPYRYCWRQGHNRSTDNVGPSHGMIFTSSSTKASQSVTIILKSVILWTVERVEIHMHLRNTVPTLSLRNHKLFFPHNWKLKTEKSCIARNLFWLYPLKTT